mmetsp:Transcript_25762/g.55060  ORF Transcript_25762/g.55060 Transcript_25762/m.55060 type:complete len:269 (+) Transcript_25762:1229-2035(+)
MPPCQHGFSALVGHSVLLRRTTVKAFAFLQCRCRCRCRCVCGCVCCRCVCGCGCFSSSCRRLVQEPGKGSHLAGQFCSRRPLLVRGGVRIRVRVRAIRVVFVAFRVIGANPRDVEIPNIHDCLVVVVVVVPLLLLTLMLLLFDDENLALADPYHKLGRPPVVEDGGDGGLEHHVVAHVGARRKVDPLDAPDPEFGEWPPGCLDAAGQNGLAHPSHDDAPKEVLHVVEVGRKDDLAALEDNAAATSAASGVCSVLWLLFLLLLLLVLLL